MARTHAVLLTEIYQECLDTGAAKILAAHATQQLAHAIRRASDDIPRKKVFSYFIESRTGKASATSSGYIVDTTETQFIVANDIDKVVHNTTDNTWAVVNTDGSNSTSKLKLSKDIMVSGESYEVYNKGCKTPFQINLEDIVNYVGENRGVIAVEYPIGTRRNFDVEGDILTIAIDSVDDSKVTDPATDTEVLVTVNVRHYVSAMVLLTGAIDNASDEAAGETVIHVDTLDSSSVFAADTEFTIAGVRGIYTTVKDTTLASNEGDITIYPPLESIAEDDDVITITGSTLTRLLEPVVVLLAAGYCLRAYAAFPALTDHDIASELAIADLVSGATLINAVNLGGPGAPGDYATQANIDMQIASGYGVKARLLRQLGNEKIADALDQLRRLRPAPASKGTYTRA
ncbi:hypothetical protein LCGC14_0369570 [marine sediment metagenome]|uniref:Uncharacterized protein n=1 Tax=marine sediment metagenome TaxID=412755 RepID=A0A0F9WDY7_9ZZZZ